jgi:hypothetical protein
VKSVNLGVRFLLEVAALVALAIWGWRASDTAAVSIALAIAAPVAMALVWGRWVAPTASHRLDDPLRLGVEVVIFATAALALVAAGLPNLGIVLAGAAALSLTLMVLWEQRGY